MESQFVEEEALWIQTGITGEKGDNIWSDHWIALQVLQLFPEAVFHVLPMESLLVEVNVISREIGIKAEKGHNFVDDVMSRQAGIKAEKDHKFWSDRWIALQVLQ